MIYVHGFTEEEAKNLWKVLGASAGVIEHPEKFRISFGRDNTAYPKEEKGTDLIVPLGTTVWSTNKDQYVYEKSTPIMKFAVLPIKSETRIFIPEKSYLFVYEPVEDGCKTIYYWQLNLNEEDYKEIGIKRNKNWEQIPYPRAGYEIYEIDTGKAEPKAKD